MKTKRALTGHTLSVILAIAAIILLFPLANKLQGVINNQDLENAKLVLDNLEAKINALEFDRNNTFPIRGISSTDSEITWHLMGYDRRHTNRPDQCFLSSCICICSSKKGTLTLNCKNNGICRNVNQTTVTTIGKEIFIPSNGIDPPSHHIEPNIPLTDTFNPIYIEKNQSTLIIRDASNSNQGANS